MKKSTLESKKNSNLFYISYLVIVLIVSLIAAEIFMRIFNICPLPKDYRVYITDKYLPYKYIPNIKFRIKRSGEFDVMVKINSVSFRDFEHNYQKPIGVYRIVGLGDSFTMGAGAEFKDSYLYKLEKMLNEKYSPKKIEIIKTGTGGYFTEPERILLEHYGIRYSPDLIIAGFLPNDIIGTYYGASSVQVKNGFLSTKESSDVGKTGMRLFKRYHLARVFIRAYISYKLKKEKPAKWEEIYKENGFHEKDWRKVEQEFQKIIEIGKSIGSPVVIVNIPEFPSFLKDVDFSYTGKRLERFSKENGYLYIDTYPQIIKEIKKGKMLFWKKDGHCTPYGYEVIARAIYEKLVESNVIR